MLTPTKKTTLGTTKKAPPKSTTSGKTPTSGHDPAGKKTGATETKKGSTYDFRKGSKAEPPTKKTKSKNKTESRLAKKRANELKRAAKKKARDEKKKARKEKRGLFAKRGK